MTVVFEHPDANRLVARLKEGTVETEVTGWNPAQSATNLLAALEVAATDGYGECFWPEATGQYWWMFRRDDRSLEIVVLWSSGGAAGWRHVFRASDEFGYVHALVEDGLSHLRA